jgi:hypothetical protein
MLNPDLTHRAFIRATQSMCGAAERWQADASTGLTDQQLHDRLAYELGSYGGTSETGLDIEYVGDGLCIWASATGFVRRTKDKPILQGQTTIAYARHTYGIRHPTDGQLALF